MTNILVVGSGGREFTLVSKLTADEPDNDIFVAPGSDGIAAISDRVRCSKIAVNDTVALRAFAQQGKIDLTIVGPEAPLVAGIVDEFRQHNLAIVGPTKAAAQIEGSKVFCKKLLQKHGIPTAKYEVFSCPNAAREYVRTQSFPVVIKADGLAAGKGVFVATNYNQAARAIGSIMVDNLFGDEAGKQIIIEKCLRGEECSVIGLCDGENVLPLVAAQDYKPALDGDKGLNTGGMGCYSPVPALTPELETQAHDILRQTVRAMKAEGMPYTGVLYAGLMITNDGLKVLEFNCRFGDPELQVILPRMSSDLLPLLQATVDGNIADVQSPDWDSIKTVCVVLAAPGYPGAYNKGLSIEGIDDYDPSWKKPAYLIHAGTSFSETNGWTTAGGRVLTLLSRGETFTDARDKVYSVIKGITFDGKKPHYRTDIALCACQ